MLPGALYLERRPFEDSFQGWLAWVFKLVKPQFLDETLVGSLAVLKKAVEG